MTRLTDSQALALGLAAWRERYPLPAAWAPVARRRLPADAWSLFAPATRYCPECLAGDGSPVQQSFGGPWLKTWHLPVVFACPAHRRLLDGLVREFPHHTNEATWSTAAPNAAKTSTPADPLTPSCPPCGWPGCTPPSAGQPPPVTAVARTGRSPDAAALGSTRPGPASTPAPGCSRFRRSSASLTRTAPPAPTAQACRHHRAATSPTCGHSASSSQQSDPSGFEAGLRSLARELSDPGTPLVNYRQRRKALENWAVDEPAWNGLIARLPDGAVGRTPDLGDRRPQVASVYAWVRVTYGEPGFAPALSKPSSPRPSGNTGGEPGTSPGGAC